MNQLIKSKFSWHEVWSTWSSHSMENSIIKLFINFRLKEVRHDWKRSKELFFDFVLGTEVILLLIQQSVLAIWHLVDCIQRSALNPWSNEAPLHYDMVIAIRIKENFYNNLYLVKKYITYFLIVVMSTLRLLEKNWCAKENNIFQFSFQKLPLSPRKICIRDSVRVILHWWWKL